MKNLSSDGDKSYDMLNKLKNDSAFKREVSKATIITISIGVVGTT